MRKTVLICGHLLFLGLSGPVCDAQENWVERHDFGGSSRWGAASFSIGDYGYAVGGRDSLSNDLSETWYYRRSTNHWQQRTSLPVGKERRLASAWAIGSYGYVSCGEYNSGNKRNDLWRFDPANNNWVQLASLPGLPRYGAYAFSIGGIAYLGGGNNAAPGGPYLQDLWAYDAANNLWSQVSGIPDQGRYGATTFTVGDTAYVFGGKKDDQSMSNELWRYVPSTDSWTQVTSMPSDGRMYAMTWSAPQGGLIAGGKGDVLITDAWLYRPEADSWVYAPPYAGAAGWNACTFSIADTAFAGLGQDAGIPYRDLWELGFGEVTGVGPVSTDASALLSVVPTMCAPGSVVRMKGPGPVVRSVRQLQLFDLTGRRVPGKFGTDELVLPSGLGTGRYIVDMMLSDGSHKDVPITVID